MSQGCYRQSLESLQDAIMAFRLSCAPASLAGHSPFKAFPPVSPSSNRRDLESMMERAARNLAAPDRCIGEDRPTSKLNAAKISVVEVSHEDVADAADIVDSILHVCPFNDSVVFPIRFESLGAEAEEDLDGCDDGELRLRATMMLYNFAIASLCRSNFVASSAQARRMREASCRFLRLCQSVLLASPARPGARRFAAEQQKRAVLYHYLVVWTSVFAVKATSGAVQSPRQSPLGPQRLMLTQLRDEVREQHKTFSNLLMKKMTAAAA